ncbi:MAG TPA: hypothetical protein VG891_05015 [Rhizomicrobium sp.]|nr:hypothetical protein [Rhizomicrobium sp.]
MTDAAHAYPPRPVPDHEALRTMSIIVYALMLASFISVHLAPIVGVVLAYVKRPDARGTIWETHFDAAISTFWVSFVILLVAIPLCFVFVGIPIVVGLVIWYLYRNIRGLVRAIDGQPF